MSPGKPDSAPPRTPWPLVLDLAKIRPWRIALVAALSLAAAATEAFSIALVIPFIEALMGGSAGPTIGWEFLTAFDSTTLLRVLIVLLIVAQVTQAGLRFLADWSAQHLKLQLDFELGNKAVASLTGMDLLAIQAARGGELYSVVTHYTQAATAILLATLRAIPAAAMMMVYVAFLIFLSWQLTILGLALSLLVAVSLNVIHRAAAAQGERARGSTVRLNNAGLEIVQALSHAKVMAVEGLIRDRFSGALGTYRDEQSRFARVSLLSAPAYQTLTVAVLGSLVIVATFTFELGTPAAAATVVTFLLVMFRLMAPATQLNALRTQIAGQAPSAAALQEFQRKQPPQATNDEPAPSLTRAVRFEGVSLTFEPAGSPTLKDISFEIPAGKTTALVGRSGSGKTTAARLMLGLYRPTAGHIYIDGAELSPRNARSWRASAGVVTQDTFLFNESIAENVRVGRPSATPEQIRKACRLAQADRFIQELPKGYDTIVGDRGIRLSGGQAQRIAIARALVRDPRIIVFDEATSALDVLSERELQEAIATASAGRTALVIAHRMATVENADRIIVFEDGRVVEQGTPADLLGLNGKFASYARTSSGDPGAENADQGATASTLASM